MNSGRVGNFIDGDDRIKTLALNTEPLEFLVLMPEPGASANLDSRPSEGSVPTMATLIGNAAPSFDLPCTRFASPAHGRVNLANYRGRWLVLVFYPRDFSLVCPTELIGLSQRFDEFAAQNCDLLGVSCDSVESHERWIATPMTRGGLGGLAFPLASDSAGTAARAYGVFQEKDHVAVRGLFIIDPEGFVQYQVVHSLSVGRRSQEVLRVLTALQSGGLCREDWMVDGPSIDPFTVIRPGSFFSHYQIEAEAGSGTFARVYRARDLQLDRSVALKVFKPDCPVTPSAALAEARAAAALNHPNLCTIYAVDDTAGVPIISMEFIAGESLSKTIRGQRLTGEALLSIARQLASGLAAAHAGGIVHGDLKPENVMITAEGLVKILDFGLAHGSAAAGQSSPTTRPSSAWPSQATDCLERRDISLPSRFAANRPPRPAMSSRWAFSSMSSVPATTRSPRKICSRCSIRSARSTPTPWPRTRPSRLILSSVRCSLATRTSDRSA